MNLYDIQAKSIDGREISFSEYRGKVLLVVNVASQCGFTPQYGGLEKLFDKYQKEGLIVLGFPCNQFGAQEPGKDSDIKSFCETSFGVKFPLFSKIEVNGQNAHPLYQFLVKAKPGLLGTEAIKWNFTKFLIDRKGTVVKRFAPADKPETIDEEIKSLLAV